jgi:hypothetical protein
MKSMSELGDFFLDQDYKKIVGLGNKLGEIRDIIDWGEIPAYHQRHVPGQQRDWRTTTQ